MVRRQAWPAATLVTLVAVACGGGDGAPLAGSGTPNEGTGGAIAGSGGSSAGAGGAGAAAGSGGSTADSGADASTGGTGGSPGSGPAITSAPPDWVRPSSCEGVGGLCVSGACGGSAVCQSVEGVCIPAPETAGQLPPKSAEHPYCVASTCMTFDEASCFCTGEGGARFDACARGPGAVAGLCGAIGVDCTARPCCKDLTCMPTGNGRGTCQDPCTRHDECSTGCCANAGLGALICAPATSCNTPCLPRGGACTQTPQCCEGVCVVGVDVPDLSGCRPYCNSGADCDTGCCRPFSNGGGYCVDAAWCACVPTGQACGPDHPACCDGSTCATMDPSQANLTCMQTCVADGDCPSGCCSLPFAGKTYGVCYDGCQAPAVP